MVKLGDVCDIYSGYAIKSFNDNKAGIPVLKIGNILSDCELDLTNCAYTDEKVNEKYYSKKGDIYIALSGATTGKIGILNDEKELIINQRVGIVRKRDDRISTGFLKYYLLKQTNRVLEDASGAAQPNISPKQISQYLLPELNSENEKKITRILDSISDLINKRKKELALLDNLIKSRFVEMFGDPCTNLKEWDECALSEKINVVGGYAFKSDQFDEERGIPVLRIGNINMGFFRPTNMVYWREDDNLERYAIYPGDLVMSLTGTVGKNDYGNVCILGDEYEKYYLNQRNAKLEIKEGIDKYFLSQLLKFESIKKKLTGINRGVRQANISNKDILGLIVPIPPMEIQSRFACFVEQIDKLKFIIVVQYCVNTIYTLLYKGSSKDLK